ncbi:MAG TPA: hypothetical protein VF634_05495 [Pyrinomonadaceae bacterium]|jgi:hypothetical protein
MTEFEDFFEDLEDLVAVEQQRGEPTVPHEEVKAEFERDELLTDTSEN